MQVSFGSWPRKNGLERMSARVAGTVFSDVTVSELDQIEPINEHIHGANRIAIVDPIIGAFWQQRRLLAISTSNQPLHRLSPQIARKHITDSVFTHPGPRAVSQSRCRSGLLDLSKRSDSLQC